MEGKTYSQTRARLLCTVSHLEGPPPLPDHGDIRVEIARRLLGRVAPQQPVIMRHPWNPAQIVFVESEPDDWREFLEQAMAMGDLERVLGAARAEGRAH